MLISYCSLIKSNSFLPQGLCIFLSRRPGTSPLLPLTHLHGIGFPFSSSDLRFTHHHHQFLSPISEFISFKILNEIALTIFFFCFLAYCLFPLLLMHNSFVESKHFIGLIHRWTTSSWKSDWYTVGTKYRYVRWMNGWLREWMNESQ